MGFKITDLPHHYQDQVAAQMLVKPAKPLRKARGRAPSSNSGEMNQTETAYAESLQLDESVAWFKYESIKLRLAKNTWFIIDFFVMRKNGDLEAHEVKGHWEDDARVKIKTAAEMYPFKFIAVKKKAKKEGGGWSVEEF